MHIIKYGCDDWLFFLFESVDFLLTSDAIDISCLVIHMQIRCIKSSNHLFFAMIAKYSGPLYPV